MAGTRKWMQMFVALATFLLLLVACSGNDSNPPVDGDSDGTDGDSDVDVENDAETAELDGDEDATEGETEPEFEMPDEPENRVVYEIWGPTTVQRKQPYNRLPFPYNFFTVSDSTAKTGLRINLLAQPTYSVPIINSNMIDTGLYFMGEIYQQHINTLDGFSTFGINTFEVYPDIDPASLPQTPEESVSDDSPIWLVQLEEGSSDFGTRIPIRVERTEGFEFGEDDKDDHEHLFWSVSVRPLRPLDPQTRYVVVVRRGLTAPGGSELEPSVHFGMVSGRLPVNSEAFSADLIQAERERFAPVMAALTQAPIGVALDDLVLAFDFTTQTLTTDLLTIQNWYDDGTLPDPDVDFDVDDDGSADLFTSASWPAEFPNANVSETNLGAMLHGTFTSMDFRLPYEVEWDTNRRRSFEYDENGDPLPQNPIDVPIVLYLPKEATSQPCPVVILEHGINSRKESVRGLVPDFLARGWAAVLMDLPYHGERNDGNNSGLSYVDIAFPLKARAAFMQSAVDHIQLANLLGNWDLDIYPAGGDGTIDIDAGRVAYVGHSLGAISGGLSVPISKYIIGGALIAGGGGLIDYVQRYLEDYGLNTLFPDHYLDQYATVAQTILDGGDSVNYARFIDNPVDGAQMKSVLSQQAIDDGTVPNAVTENFARAASLPHIMPVQRSVEGLTPTEAPVSRIGYMQFDPMDHGAVFSGTYPENRDRMRAQVYHFLETLFEDGEAEIISPE